MRVISITAWFILALLYGAVAPSNASAATFYVTTGLGAHETVISSNNPAIWTFDTGPNNLFGGAVVAIKHGVGATFGIQLQFLDSTGTPHFFSSSYATVAAFLSAGGQSDFARFVFELNSPYGVGLNTYETYTVRFSLIDDNSGDGANQTYSIRGFDGPIALTTAAEADIVVTDNITTTPEPATALILAAGLLGLGLIRRRGAILRATA